MRSARCGLGRVQGPDQLPALRSGEYAVAVVVHVPEEAEHLVLCGVNWEGAGDVLDVRKSWKVAKMATMRCELATT